MPIKILDRDWTAKRHGACFILSTPGRSAVTVVASPAGDGTYFATSGNMLAVTFRTDDHGELVLAARRGPAGVRR